MIAQEIRVSGAVVSWSLSPTNRAKLRTVLASHGYDDEVPPETSDRAAFKAALEAVKGKQQIVKPLKSATQNGYAVATIVKGEVQNDYPHDFAARVENGRVELVNGYYQDDFRDQIQEQFDAQKALLPSSAVSAALKSIVLRMGAVMLYPGTYWLPEDAKAFWEPLAYEVERCGEKDSRIRQLTTIMDVHTFREVRDAIVSEVTAAATEIAEDVAKGTLGDEALENRRNQATALHDRISQYEAILNETLDGLHTTVENVQKATMLAMLQTVGV